MSAFNFDVALATWRHVMKNERALTPEDLDELEQHVRDQTAWLMAEGLTEEAAFRRTMQEMGDQGSIQAAYRDVFWKKMKHRKTFADEVSWRWSLMMHHATLTLRTLARSKVYSGVTIAGLAVGLAAFMLIGLFIRHELSYDRHFADPDRLYRVIKQDPGSFHLGNDRFAYTPVPLPDALEAEIPGVEVATQISPVSGLLKVEAGAFMEDGLLARASFFDVFSFDVLSGDAATALAGPDRMVLTESLARSLFHDEDPVGERITYLWNERERDMEITAVVADPPSNTHFSFGYLVSMESDRWWQRGQEQWDNSDRYTYFKAEETADPAVLASSIEALGVAKLSPLSWYQENPERISRYDIQPVVSIHQHSDVNFEIQPTGDYRTTLTLGLVAIFILLIACINYMNLATARSATRAREIGIRQVSGARQGQLIQQFLGESLVISGFAAVVAVILAMGFLPAFNSLVGRSFSLYHVLSPGTVWTMAAAMFIVALVSGSYPAFALSRLRPAHALGGHRQQRTRSRLRSMLVVSQYAVGIVLMTVTIVVNRQVGYMTTADTGLSREQVLAVSIQDEALEEQIDSILDQMRGLPNVTNVASSWTMPTDIRPKSSVTRFEGNEEETRIQAYNTAVGYDWIDMLDLTMVEGRAFSVDKPGDEYSGLIINERFKEAAGWEQAVGKTMDFGGRGDHVVGVVKDFHFQSLKREIEPLVLYLAPKQASFVLVKFATDEVSGTMAGLAAVMKEFSPDFPFEYRFLDEAYASMYRTEVRFGRIFEGFAVLAILIACLGLFALSAFMADQRRNELGVRKALGATQFDIIRELSGDFLRLILVAIAIASPVAWVLMDRWLEDFAYRVHLDWFVPAAAAFIALGVGLITVAWQSVKASRVPPAEVLRQS